MVSVGDGRSLFPWRVAIGSVRNASVDFAGRDADPCISPLTPSRLLRQIGAVAIEFARLSGGDTDHLVATVTDAVAIRTSHPGCANMLPPRAVRSGFMQASMLVAGVPHTLHWNTPHGTTDEDLAWEIAPSQFVLHHSGIRFHARHPADRRNVSSDTLWLHCHIWFSRGGPHQRAKKRKVATLQLKALWETRYITTASDARLVHISDHLASSLEAWGVDASLHSSEDHVCAREGVRRVLLEGAPLRAAQDVQRAALASTPGFGHRNYSASLPVLRIIPSRAGMPPQPAAPGSLRALFVLSTGAADGLRINLHDPRPPGVRLLPELGKAATWPFGVRNLFATPRISRGMLLLLPSSLVYSVPLAVNASEDEVVQLLEFSLAQVGQPEAVGTTDVMMGAGAPDSQGGVNWRHLTAPLHRGTCAALDSTAFVEVPTTTSLHPTSVTVSAGSASAHTLEAVAAAAKFVRRAARTTVGANISNIGGWQSRADFLMDQPKLLEPLYPIVYDAILSHLALTTAPNATVVEELDVRLSGWANANRRGNSNALHDHVDQDWALSGVVFLDDGGDESCALRFASPLPGGIAPPHAAATPPLPGRVVVFPAWLPHWVPVHCGPRKRSRISVAFNAAALLPSRVWEDGQPSRPAPQLASAVRERRRASHAGSYERHDLWPLHVTRAAIDLTPERTEATATLVAAAGTPLLRCCIGSSADDDRCPVACMDLEGVMGVVFRPIARLLEHHISHSEASASTPGASVSSSVFVVAHVRDFRDGALFNESSMHTALANGVFFPPAAGDAGISEPEANCYSRTRRLVFPDVRLMAGDLSSHVAARTRDERSSFVAPDGALFAFPSWASGFVYTSCGLYAAHERSPSATRIITFTATRIDPHPHE